MNEKCPHVKTCAFGSVTELAAQNRCDRCEPVGLEYLNIGAYLYCKKIHIPENQLLVEAFRYQNKGYTFTLTGEPVMSNTGDVNDY